MDAPRQSPAAFLCWPQVGYLLKLGLDSAALPARCHCPLCRHPRLLVCADPRCGGVWFHCPGCGRAGDLIELAATLWEVSLPVALELLARQEAVLPDALLTPTAVADYLRDYPDYRQRFAELWQRAQHRGARAVSAEVLQLYARLHIYPHLAPDLWQRGPGQLVGALPHNEIEASFCPRSTGWDPATAVKPAPRNPSRGRVFHGPGWGDVLVVPYYDLPGRIGALAFIGREGGPGDRVFRPLRTLVRSGSNQYARQPPHKAEAGLAGLDTLDQAHPGFGPTVFAVADVTLALRLQVRHLQLNLQPLPLVCWHEDDHTLTRTIWPLLADRPIVFWAWRLTAAVVYQALQAEGQLVIAGPESLSREAVDHYLRRDIPMHRLKQLQRRAQPWREAVRAWCAQQADGAITELWLGLEPYRVDVGQIARECGGGRLEDLVPARFPVRTVRLGTRTIVERGAGWYVRHKDGQESVLIDAILRIDTVEATSAGLQYRGRVLYQGAEVPYTVLAAELEAHSLRWLRELLVRAGKGVVCYAPGLRGLVEIALQFQKPVVGSSSERDHNGPSLGNDASWSVG